MVGRETKSKLKVRLPKSPPMARMKRRSKEWNTVWKLIVAGAPIFGNADDWEYVGSFQISSGWSHEFESRGRYLRFRSSPDWKPPK